MSVEFVGFPKIARLNRDIIITEKLDGTNAQVHIRPADDRFEFGVDTQVEYLTEPYYVRAGSRNRWLKQAGKDDNFGFGAWVYQHAHELAWLGVGQHFGEWWGSGIGRGYGLLKGDKRFSLFNVSRWGDDDDTGARNAARPACCGVVPTIYAGAFDGEIIEHYVGVLRRHGSFAAPSYYRPEGIVVFHTAAGQLFKVTLENDEVPKALVREAA